MFKLICVVQVFVAKLVGAVQDSDAPKNGSIILRCMHETAGVRYVEWWEDIENVPNNKIAANWIDGTHNDYLEWSGRTDIPSADGDLTINNLILDDDGIYTCRYGTSDTIPPWMTGAEYKLELTGNVHDDTFVVMKYM